MPDQHDASTRRHPPARSFSHFTPGCRGIVRAARRPTGAVQRGRSKDLRAQPNGRLYLVQPAGSEAGRGDLPGPDKVRAGPRSSPGLRAPGAAKLAQAGADRGRLEAGRNARLRGTRRQARGQHSDLERTANPTPEAAVRPKQRGQRQHRRYIRDRGARSSGPHFPQPSLYRAMRRSTSWFRLSKLTLPSRSRSNARPISRCMPPACCRVAEAC